MPGQFTESTFRNRLCRLLSQSLGKKYNISENSNLLYKTIVTSNRNFEPLSPEDLKRGRYTFQTDILIKDSDELPLVVLELKYGGFSTHDVLIYSRKADEHKRQYPYLRYGFVVGGISKIQHRFLTHNTSLDFAFAIEDIEQDFSTLLGLVKDQIKISRDLLKVIRNRSSFKLFETKLLFF